LENGEAILNEFREWLVMKGKSSNTVKTYVGVIESFNEWLLKNKASLKELSTQQIQAYLDNLDEKQMSVGTIDKVSAVISVYAKFLGKPQLMINIVKKEMVRSEAAPECLNAQEKAVLLKKVELDRNIRNQVIVHTLLQTGIRVSELCALNGSDVVLTDENPHLIARNEKGEVDRVIPISRDLRKRLNDYFDKVGEKSESDPLFLSSVRKRLTTRSVQYMLQKYHVHPHKLRHTFCQELINHGVDIRTVAKLAGHRDINITKRYYQHIEVDLESAINQTFA
jgi:integrase/recombinase XerD